MLVAGELIGGGLQSFKSDADVDKIDVLMLLNLLFDCLSKERVGVRLMERSLLRPNFKTSHLVSLIKWLAWTRHNISGLKQDKFAFLEVDVVGNKDFNPFYSTSYVELAALQEITNFLLRSLLQGGDFWVKVCFCDGILGLINCGLVEESLGARNESPVIE